MAVTIQLPEGIEEQLRRQIPDLDEAARNQFILANYKLGRISTGDIALILGFDTRHEVEQWLDRQGIRANYDLKSLEADRQTLAEIMRARDS